MSPSRDPLQHPRSILLNNIRSSSINIATMALAAEYFSHALSQPYGSSFWVAVAASLVVRLFYNDICLFYLTPGLQS